MSQEDEIEALNALVELNEAVQEQNFASMSKFFDDLFSVYASNFKKEERPSLIETSYDGVHLSKNYEVGDFKRMIESFRNKQNIHAKYALRILEDAIKNFEKLPNIVECNLTKTKSYGIVIVGDLHGSFKDLYHLISEFGIPGEKFSFVFNGDFVDRGPQQSEVLLTLLYAFLLNPGKVFLNRGNHEDLSINIDANFSPNFKQDTELKFGKYSLAVFNDSQRLFRRLPLATIVQNNTGFRIFVTHGGLSDRIDLNYIKSSQFNRFQFSSISKSKNDSEERKKMADQLIDLLWSDPTNDHKGCKPNNHRGVGYLFGPDVSENFCKRHGFNGIIRSHEVCQKGIELNHAYCYTVFSSSRYCGGKNQAAVYVIEANNNTLRTRIFDMPPLEKDVFDNQKKRLIQGLKSYLRRQVNQLIPKFQQYDQNKSGHINIGIWAQIISDHINSKIGIKINPKNIITLKDNLCPCYDDYYTAEYMSMFKGVPTKHFTNQQYQFIRTLFNLIDSNGSGSISLSEADRAAQILNKKLGTSYKSSIFNRMDSNKDGEVDFNEFYKAFVEAV